MPKITVDLRKRQLIYEQIVENVKEQIMNGTIVQDEYLPSVRTLANELGINPNTIQKAYSELERQGITRSLSGRGHLVISDCEKLRMSGNSELVTEVKKLAHNCAKIGMSYETFCSSAKEVFDKEANND